MSFEVGQQVRITSATKLKHLVGREGEVVKRKCKATGFIGVRLRGSFVWLCFPERELEYTGAGETVKERLPEEQPASECEELRRENKRLNNRLQTFAIEIDDANKALLWKGIPRPDEESVAQGIERLYAKLTGATDAYTGGNGP